MDQVKYFDFMCLCCGNNYVISEVLNGKRNKIKLTEKNKREVPVFCPQCKIRMRYIS